MQDRFVGDIGDFGKYGLLRALTGLWDWERQGPLPESERLSLGVVWYYREEKGLNYLRKPEEYRACDEELFPHLDKVITGSTRTIAEIEKSGVLGSETSFYSIPVPLGKNQRENWISDAVNSMMGRDIIFFDPDNGLHLENRMSSKHAFLAEVEHFSIHEQTIIIYQSFGQQQKHDKQMQDWAENIPPALGFTGAARILRFRSGGPRAFIILPAAKHANLIDERLKRMLDGPWSRHFKCP